MNYFVLLCGGNGTRTHFKTPKQFLKINRKEVFLYSLDAAIKTNIFDKYIIVANPLYFGKISKIIKNRCDFKLVKCGYSRQESVFNALNNIEDSCKYVFIHDSARPLITNNLLNVLYNDVQKYGSAIPYNPISSSIYNLNIGKYESRKDFVEVQTPQCFLFKDIKKAYDSAFNDKNLDFTDDGSIYSAYIKKPHLSLNETPNIKLTYQDDFYAIRRILYGKK